MTLQCGNGITKGFSKGCRHDMRTIYIIMCVVFAAIFCPTVFARLHPHVQFTRDIGTQTLLDVVGNGVGIDIDSTILPGYFPSSR